MFYSYNKDSVAAIDPAFEEEFDAPLTDEELLLAEDGIPWSPPEEEFLSFIDTAPAKQARQQRIFLTPAEFTTFAFRMPKSNGGGYENFSFEGRRHVITPYNTPARRLLLVAARQVEKSTLLGNSALSHCCMIPSYKVLYVSPSATQTKTFSIDRVKEPIETSDVLRAYTTRSLSQNVFEKQFVNRSKITLRYAFLNADRTRGIPAHRLLIDELQDILTDNIPVIEQCTSHAPEHLKSFIYSGTPKSLDNTIEVYRSQRSTQGEWMVPCDCKGGEGGRYWNILTENSIGLKSLICQRCGKGIHPMHPDAQWAHQVAWDEKKAPWESYRIPQLMVPWKPWSEILYDRDNYPRDRFYNEVLGLSYDSGMRPLTRAQLIDCCNPNVRLNEDALRVYLANSRENIIYAGIDWGADTDASYTVLVLGTFVGTTFRIFYAHRFVGEDVSPEKQLDKICAVLHHFNVRRVGTDYGGGQYGNDRLVRTFGRNRMMRYQYVGRAKRKLEYKPLLNRFMASRTEVMSDIFNAIKRHRIEFPCWEDFAEPYGNDMLNIFSEYNELRREVVYKHSPGKPDDTFHATTYCVLAAMIDRPMPDVIAPNRELPGTHYQGGTYTGPTRQN